MPIISTGFNTLAPNTTVTFEIDFNPGNPFLPVPVAIAKPFFAIGNTGVSLGVSNVRTTIRDVGGTPAYTVLVDVTNQASVGGPIRFDLVVGFAQ